MRAWKLPGAQVRAKGLSDRDELEAHYVQRECEPRSLHAQVLMVCTASALAGYLVQICADLPQRS